MESFKDMFAGTIIARKAITDKHGVATPQKVVIDVMVCPFCRSNVLRYGISSVNGHISAKKE